MGDEIMIERLENAYNRRMSAYSRGGMYAPYDPEEDEIFRALYCGIPAQVHLLPLFSPHF